MQPLVTVLMPVYNCEKYVREAIESILSQTYTNYIFLIINDGSIDNTENIILSYTDQRIQYERNEKNMGLIFSLNKGLALVKTKYIARMDADDVSLPDRLQRQVDYMELNSNIGVLGSWFQTFNEDKVGGISRYTERHQDIIFNHLYQQHICHPSCMIRFSVLEAESPWYDVKYVHAEDYDLFTRLSHKTVFANIPEVLLKIRKHKDEVSVIYEDIQKKNSLKIKKREFLTIGFESISEKQIQNFELLNYQNYNCITETPGTMKKFLENMIMFNCKSKYFSENFLYEKLSTLWFNYCYELHLPIQIFKSSFLYNKDFLTVRRKFKWYINYVCSKCI